MAFVLSTRLNLDHAQIQLMLRGPSGPVMRFMRATSREMLNRAQRKAPVKTGHLRDSHSERTEVNAGSIVITIENSADYAEYVHEGTRAHVIRPKTPGGVLAWRGTDGKMVFATVVHHPGTKPNRWLLEAMEEVGRVRGFRVSRR